MRHFGNLIIDDRRELNGQILGKVHVIEGGKLLLQRGGQILGGLTIEKGGEAEIHGQICGVVDNLGSLTLLGQIIGFMRGNAAVNPLNLGQIIGRRAG